MTPTPTSGPLGRDSMKFSDKMARYHAAMENALYAAEQACPYSKQPTCEAKECAFLEDGGYMCTLHRLRKLLGDHVPQHDIPQVEVTR